MLKQPWNMVGCDLKQSVFFQSKEGLTDAIQDTFEG